MNYATQQTPSIQAQIIDHYIELGYSYEGAYMMWEDDYNRGVIVEEEWEVEEEVEQEPSAEELAINTFTRVAQERGFTLNEAQTIANNIVKLQKEGNYQKAYKLYIKRLTA